MIFLFGVYVPDVRLVRSAFYDVIDGHHRGEHRVVRVVVLVHPVAAYQKQIVKIVQIAPQQIKLSISPKVRGVGFGHPDNGRVEDGG